MTRNYELDVRKLIAFDNLDIPLSALHNRIDRRHKTLAQSLESPIDSCEDFGEAIVEVEYQDKKKARALTEAVKEFCEIYPVQGRKLKKIITVKRTMRETYLHYGFPKGRRISQQDYIHAMIDVGLTKAQAENFYPKVLEISRRLLRKSSTFSGSILSRLPSNIPSMFTLIIINLFAIR